MNRLRDAVVALVTNSPADKVEQLANAIRALSDSEASESLLAWAPNPASKIRLTDLVSSWKVSSMSAVELAGFLRGAAAIYTNVKAGQEIEIVWTGPSSALMATRKTEQALLEVIEASLARLFITSFVAYDVASILKALERAIVRQVRVSMLLEASEKEGGAVSFDVIGKMKTALPAAIVYSWTDKGKFADGKVHAKIAVADERICFVSSANLTGHAMERNMEAGILISGGNAPRDLHRHLEALVTTHVVVKA
jgi:phosphatidylserine/phosphatidylglycerophosphate/cardiolipin synthase-like enzyme